MDADLTRLLGVESPALNQAVNHNLNRFLTGFPCSQTRDKISRRSQTITSLGLLNFANALLPPPSTTLQGATS